MADDDQELQEEVLEAEEELLEEPAEPEEEEKNARNVRRQGRCACVDGYVC